MNVGSYQPLIGGASQMQSNSSQSTNALKGGFGSVFNTMMTGNAVAKTEVLNMNEVGMNEAITSILHATSTEEIISILNNTEINTSQLVEELTEVADAEVDLNIELLIEQIIPLLEESGLSQSELEAAEYATDIWSLLNILNQVGPKFFTELTNGLEGNGAISKENAIQLLARLKSIEVEGPKRDLLEKQEQQIFTLQGFLAVVSEKVEAIQPTNQNRQTVAQMLETQQAIRIIPQAQTGQQTTEEGLKESPRETIQQPVVAPNQQTFMREEIRLAQPEANNHARNEALMREMQNIFKRSNFGQAGGTHRLLVKLYPEHLGQVRIELLQQNGVMTARILASTALGKEMLDSQLHQLRAAFAQQNLQVERIDISQTLQDASRNERDNAFNQHFKREQEQTEQQQEQSSGDERSFEEYMIELEA